MNSCEFTCRPCDGDCPSDTMLTEHVSEGDAARLLAAFRAQDVENEVPLLHRLVAFAFEQGDQNGYTRAKEGG